MKKVVLRLDLHDDKDKKKVLKVVSSMEGIESITVDTNDRKLTVTGDVNPAALASKLRKVCTTDILMVGPAKEVKKKEGPKKEEPPKKGAADDKKNENKLFPHPMIYYPPPEFSRSSGEDPNGCVNS